MCGLYPVELWLWLHFGLEGLGELGKFCLGVYEVYLCQEIVGVEYLADVWPHLVCEHGEYPYHLSPLCCLQLAHLVVGLHHFGWLDEDGLSRCRLVVYYAVDLSLHSG